jgi:hypothetical protein
MDELNNNPKDNGLDPLQLDDLDLTNLNSNQEVIGDLPTPSEITPGQETFKLSNGNGQDILLQSSKFNAQDLALIALNILNTPEFKDFLKLNPKDKGVNYTG